MISASRASRGRPESAKSSGQAASQRRSGFVQGKFEDAAAVVGQLEGDFGMGNGQADQCFADVAELGGGALEEFSPGGSVEEEIPHFDGGADIARGGLGLVDLAAAIVNLVSDRLVGRAA